MADIEGTTDAETIVRTAIAAAAPLVFTRGGEHAPPDVLVHNVADGYEIRTTDLEQFAANPRRARGTVYPGTVDDFVKYVERFGDDRTTVWVHAEAGRVEAVLDDHLPVHPGIAIGDEPVPLLDAVPGHGDHRAILQLLQTPEWAVWADADGKQFNQVDFAEHIEANAKEIVEPNGADLLELAQSFHAVSSATFRSAKRLVDGQTQVQYDETINASAGKSGELKVPPEFTLAIRPFVGEPAYALTARLRYRVSSGNLSLSYLLNRPHDVVRDALEGVAKRLAETFPNVYVGTPR